MCYLFFMARPPRIEFPGALYHIIVRGNRKQDIFHDNQDRLQYLNRLEHYKKERDFALYSYVLMTNHVHLLIESRKTPISRIMQLLNFTYTMYFNKKYGTVGHLFQGRYKAFLCDKDKYLLALVRYLHLNPVRAKVVASPEEYEWSSHNDYLSERTGIVDTEQVLRMFSERKLQARKLYREFILEAIGEGKNEEIYKGVEQQILGDDIFVEKVRKKMDREIGCPAKISLKMVLRAVGQVTGVEEDVLRSKSKDRETVSARALIAGVWKEAGGKLGDLVPVFQRDLSVISKLAKTAMGKSKDMKKVLQALNATLQA